MNTTGPTAFRDEALLLARLLLALLFLFSGWSKLLNFGGTTAYLTQLGVPVPMVAAAVATAVELLGGLALLAGFRLRIVVLVMALFTLGTTLLGHHYWTMEGAARQANWINFYKNLCIMGGFLALYVAGSGRYALDGRRSGS